MKFWLDKGVDGFRLDVANAYVKDGDFRDNPSQWNPLNIPTRQTHVYDRDRPETIAIHQEFRKLVDTYPERFMVGEISGGELASRPLADTAKYAGPDRLHTVFNFLFTHQPWDPRAFAASIAAWDSALAERAWPCYTLSNHDVPRHVSRYGKRDADERAKVAAAMLLTLRGTPFLYYGEEIGMRQVRIPPWRLRDGIAKRYWPFIRGRDGCRTPMQWSRARHAGFSTVNPWLPVGGSYRTHNVADEKDDPRSLLSWYRALIRLRKESPALRRGRYRQLVGNSAEVLAYCREGDGENVLVVLNFSPRRARVSLAAEAGAWQVVCSNSGRAGKLAVADIRLAPYEVCIARSHV
jgi:alpha-glucosidase